MGATINGTVEGSLRLIYLAQLRQRQSLLTPIAERISRGTVRLGDYETLEQEAHKLGGSGKVYGFEDISTTASAARIEPALRPEYAGKPRITYRRAILAAMETALIDAQPAPQIVRAEYR